VQSAMHQLTTTNRWSESAFITCSNRRISQLEPSTDVADLL
jgi:hypothetical protein